MSILCLGVVVTHKVLVHVLSVIPVPNRRVQFLCVWRKSWGQLEIRYILTAYSDDEFIASAARRLKQEGIDNEELALYIANAVLRALGRKSLRDIIRIARKSKTMEDVDETILAFK